MGLCKYEYVPKLRTLNLGKIYSFMSSLSIEGNSHYGWTIKYSRFNFWCC